MERSATNRHFLQSCLNLVLVGFFFGHQVYAQLHQPFRDQGVQQGTNSAGLIYQNSTRYSRPYFEPYNRYQNLPSGSSIQNNLRPVANYQPGLPNIQTGQLPPAPAEFRTSEPALQQPVENSIPAPPQTFPQAGGHTFEPGRNLPTLTQQSGSLYQSPYDGGAGHSFSMPDQSFSYPSQPQDCLDCLGNDFGGGSTWGWTVLPKDILYQSYLGGPREPRFGQAILYQKGTGAIWSLEAGGRAGVLRYGSGPGQPLEGWQLDIWGAAFPRLNMNEMGDLEAADFRVGVPITWRKGPVQMKFEWSHLSSHAGDEYMIRNPGFVRINYLRDSFLLGGGYFVTPDLRLYADAEYAYNTDGGSKPWHFQFGFDYSPVAVSDCYRVLRPQPFFAVASNIRQEVNYSGGINVVAGLQWRSDESTSLFRIGLQYYQGQSLQYEFLGDYEELIGFGMWYDF